MLKIKEGIELAVTGMLILVLIFMLVNLGKNKRPRRLMGASLSSSGLQGKRAKKFAFMTDVKKTKQDISFRQLEEESRGLVLKGDPFAPGASAASTQPNNSSVGLSLTGIIWDKNTPLAIIDDNMVKPGDSVGKIKVIEISRDKVFLSDGNNNVTLRLE